MKLTDLGAGTGCCAAAVLLLAGALGGAALADEGACFKGAAEARAAQVADARALTLDDGRVLRIAGIEPFDLLRPDLGDAEAALERRLSELVNEATVSVQFASEEVDRYGRRPALVAAAGVLLQESLAGEGLVVAFASGDPLPCFERILAAEEAARRAGRGFWRDAALPQARPELLAARIGHFAIFEGEIISVGSRSTRTYLNFGRRWSQDVTVEIEARDRRRFGGEAGLAALAGQRVRVRGFLEAKAGPMMAIRSPMQLEVLNVGAGGKGQAP